MAYCRARVQTSPLDDRPDCFFPFDGHDMNASHAFDLAQLWINSMQMLDPFFLPGLGAGLLVFLGQLILAFYSPRVRRPASCA
jgi:hypothetical protein